MAALLRQGARRIGGSVIQRTQAALTSPAVAEERRLLVPRRMINTGERAPLTPRQEYLEKKYGHLKAHQVCWDFIKLFPGGKVLGLVTMTGTFVAFSSATRELRLEREEAEKKAEQSASTELKQQRAEKKREQSASTELEQQLAH